MISTYSKEGKVLTFKLTEEIDQHTADKIRRKVDGDIERKVIFDFSDILFMDSSGIGMVLGRYKLVKLLGGQFEIINVKKRLKRIFDMSGVSRIIPIQMDEEENNEGII